MQEIRHRMLRLKSRQKLPFIRDKTALEEGYGKIGR